MNKNIDYTTVGTHLGKAIRKNIESDGGCPLDQLNKDEVMLKAGLIYKRTG